jgi:hypothetical protein
MNEDITKRKKTNAVRKRSTVPILKLHEGGGTNEKNVPVLQRSHSDGDLSCTSGRQKSLQRMLVEYGTTRKLVENINLKLDEIREKALYENSSKREGSPISDSLERFQEHLDSLISSQERTPRILSRCDAVVGNTQVILKKIEQLGADIKGHDACVIAMLSTANMGMSMMNNRITKMSRQIEHLEKLVQQIADKKDEELFPDPDKILNIPSKIDDIGTKESSKLSHQKFIYAQSPRKANDREGFSMPRRSASSQLLP